MRADLDHEIDRTVRSMLDREPPHSLRARVLASIDGRSRPRRIAASLIPAVVVGAAIVLAIIVAPWPASRRPVQISAERDVRLPAPVADIAPTRHDAESLRPRVRKAARAPRTIVAAVLADGGPTAAGIDALSTPAPLSVGTLSTPAASAISSIQPAPLRVTALDLPALELPPDAARGVDR